MSFSLKNKCYKRECKCNFHKKIKGIKGNVNVIKKKGIKGNVNVIFIKK